MLSQSSIGDRDNFDLCSALVVARSETSDCRASTPPIYDGAGSRRAMMELGVTRSFCIQEGAKLARWT